MLPPSMLLSKRSNRSTVTVKRHPCATCPYASRCPGRRRDLTTSSTASWSDNEVLQNLLLRQMTTARPKMGREKSPQAQMGGQGDLLDQEQHGEQQVPQRNEERNRPTNRLTLLAVFLAGALVAAAGHILVTERLHWVREQELRRQAHLPDPGFLTVVDDPMILPQEQFHSFSTKQIKAKDASEVQTYKECEKEAVKTVQAALRSKSTDKARRLFNHAISVCPDHPVVLVNYGEFLEQTEENVMQADQLFTRVVRMSPAGSEEHSKALQAKKRTAAMVEEMDLRALMRVDEKKKLFHKVGRENEAAMAMAKKEAYSQHIFHTIGIEGNTLSLSEVKFVLETQAAVNSKSIAELNEVLGLDLALKYVNTTLVDRMSEISFSDVLEIHRRVLGHVDPFTAGAVRETQVFVSNHVPPPPGQLERALGKFIEWLNHPDRSNLHAVQLAALAHYKLVHIHPFADGNGRTSRLLMNLVLMQSGFPPVIIRKQDRQDYFRRLVLANEGDVRPFIRLIAECTERTLDAFIAAASNGSSAAASNYSGLMPFVDESETTITAQDRADYHNAIIMGGSVGDNTIVQPSG